MSDAHAGHHGMKVKSDPASRHYSTREGAGPVTADSLAAESTHQGGGFAQNRDSEPLMVKGANSTFTNTDISAAVTLPPAANHASRSDPNEEYIHLGTKHETGKSHGSGTGSGTVQDHSQDEHHSESVSEHQSTPKDQKPPVSQDTASSESHEGGGPSSSHGSGQESAGKQSGSEHDSSEHTTGKGTGSSHGEGDQSTVKAAGKGTGSHQPEVAPTYVDVDVVNPPIHPKPKGANLTEGGFDSDNAPNASSNAEIGSEDDPGRVAEAQIQKAMAHTAEGSAGSGLKQKKITDDGQYDALPAEEEA